MAAKTAGEPAARHPYGVLVVDHDALIARMLEAICQDEGYEAARASDATEALTHLATHTGPHIVFVYVIDAHMEPSLLRYLRGNPALRRRLCVVVYGDPFRFEQIDERYGKIINLRLGVPWMVEALVETLAKAESLLAGRRGA
jgi:DNA-binding NtrC family response regulator